MSNWPFRFVHASDFHLERVPSGITEVPDHLRELFIESAYLAAERVFETALAEEAEMLILSGDILHPQQTGPRGPLFLVEQFERLADRNIAVYWTGGSVDSPEAWPSALALPDNVHVFGKGQVEEFVHNRDETPLARLLGVSCDRKKTIRPKDFKPDSAGLFTIAVVHGSTEAKVLKKQEINYWALGGRHARSTPFGEPHIAHYPGSPQGRCPDEADAHGCTLVQVEDGRARCKFIATDAMRWITERVAVDEATTREGIEDTLRDRINAAIDSAGQTDLMISWNITGTGDIYRRLRSGNLGLELMDWLRTEYGCGSPAAWSVSLQAEPAHEMREELLEQETILGDFLRAVENLQTNPSEQIALESYLAEKHIAGTLGDAVALKSGVKRERVLREAAALGVDLLSGEEVSA